MKSSVSAEAEHELTGAAVRYAQEADTALGLALIEEFERVVKLLSDRPGLCAEWRSRKRFPLRRFPYSVIYYVKDDELRIIALAHHRRSPHYWDGRV